MNELTKKQQLWSREKYRVMFHSQKHYNEIREVLKQGTDLERVDQLIEEAGKVEPTKGSVSNAYQHMWGYFKKYATEEEKEAYGTKLDAFMEDQLGSDDLLSYLKGLAVKYEVEYLLRARFCKKIAVEVTVGVTCESVVNARESVVTVRESVVNSRESVVTPQR